MNLNFEAVSLFIVSFFHLMMGVPFFKERSKGNIYFYYFLFCFALFLWTFLFGAIYVSTGEWTRILARTISIPTLVLPYAFLSLVNAYPNKRVTLSKLSKGIHFAFVVSILCLMPTSHYIYDAYFEDGRLFFSFGWAYILLTIYVQVPLIYGAAKLLVLGIKNNAHRTETILVALGVALSLCTTIIFTSILPSMGYGHLSYWAPSGCIFLTIMWGIALSKNSISECSLYISNGLAKTILVLISLFVYFLLLKFFEQNIVSYSIVAFVLLAIFSDQFIEAVQTPIRKKMLNSIDFEEAVAGISNDILRAENKLQTLEVIGNKFKELFELTNFYVLMESESKESNQSFLFYKKGKEEAVRELTLDASFLDFFIEKCSILGPQEIPNNIINTFNQNVSNEFDNKLRGVLFLPIISLGHFSGMIILGPKPKKKEYSEYDKLILQSIMHQIMVAFDKLAHQEHLGESNKKLAAANNELTEQIELKEKALAVAKDASTYETFANLTKQISHEIRNPMTGIMLTVDAFETKVERAGGNPEPKQLNTFMENIRYMSGRIFNILDTMLRYGKSKTPNKVAVNLKDVMSAVEVLMNLYAKNKNVKIQNNITESTKVKGFQTRLEQVFTNLVKNAVEAFPKGKMDGKVTVSLTPESYTFKNKRIEKGVRIDVSDNGKGIEEDKLKNIFDPFITHKSGGTGLGLSVVHDIIDDHEGAITIQSEVDKGTTFSVFLPLAG